MKKKNHLLIGAGPSCLAYAVHSKADCLILEKEARPGGLCRSVTVDGGVFDLGGHSFHTPHDEVFEMVQSALSGGLSLQKRHATVFTHGKLIPYPFQKSFDQIPDPAVVAECQQGLDARSGNGSVEPSNFEEFIIQKFGQGIADHFMLPYNRKLWACDIKMLSCEWTGQRVAEPKGSASEVKFKTTGGGGDRKPLQSDSTVGYPTQGGFEEIFISMAKQAGRIEYCADVAYVDPLAKMVHCHNGSSYTYDRLISSMPLPDFLARVQGVPSHLIDLAAELECMSLRVEFLLVGRHLETEVQRIYCANPDIPPHKIALNHNSSDSLRAVDRHAIMAEVSISPQKPVKTDEIAPKTIDLLVNLGILDSPEDVIWTGHEDIHYGYPVYTHRRPAIIAEVKAWLAQHDIHTIGRFGEWEYINSDKCVLKGIQLAKEHGI
jgi:UDP-galactopyranose mutase